MADIPRAKITEDKDLLFKVLELLPVGVWLMDDKGLIIYGNSAGQRIWAGAKYVGPEQFGEYKGWWVSTGKKIKAEEWAASRAISKGEISVNEEIEIECFDGTHKIILNSALPVRGGDGEITGAIIVNQDITAIKSKINEIERLNKFMINRELEMVDLKKKIEVLNEKLLKEKRT